mgnify:CR=1 FL=1
MTRARAHARAFLFVYLFKNPLGITQILGVNLFVFIFNIAGSNLRHSPVRLGFGKCEYLFISPAQHQIHHSKKHFNKNVFFDMAVWLGLKAAFLLRKPPSSKRMKVEQYVLISDKNYPWESAHLIES